MCGPMSAETDAGRRLSGAGEVEWITVQVNDLPVPALRGEPLTATLVAAGVLTLGHSHKSGSPRGMYCGMGVCFECLVGVKGRGRVRACMTQAEAGMEICLEER